MKCLVCVLALPLLAQQDATVYSLDKEKALGHHFASEVRRHSRPVVDPATAAYVGRIGTELTEHLEDAPYEYHFEVIVGDGQTEPIPLPGGNIFIPARAIVAAQDEAEFIGMLAHSIGHSALRQVTPTAAREQVGNTATIPLVFVSGWGGLHSDSEHQALSTPAGFMERQRSWELEADRLGLTLTARAGYDPTAYMRFVQRVPPQDTRMWPPSAYELRIAGLQKALSTLNIAQTVASGEEFLRVQQALRSVIDQPEPRRRVPTLRR